MEYSISQITAFKGCRRAYQLHYRYGMTPNAKAEALEVGGNYHELIENLYKSGEVKIENHSKEEAMAVAYQKYIYPKLKCKTVEEPFTCRISNEDDLIGRVDGIAEDGNLVEHKSTGYDITEKYEYDLLWNEQVLAYMYAYRVRKMYYTVCRKPTIRIKKNETEEEFFNRMVEWYDEDTDSKIKLLEVERTDEEVEQFHKELVHIIAQEKACESDLDFYKSTSYCNMWGRRCEYSSICLNFDPNQEYIDFHKEERRTTYDRESIQ